MASIKLTGDTSGEITISAPAVAGTNTLTLPAETGNILTNDTSGTILQVVSTTKTDFFTTTSTTMTDITGLSVSITPSSTSNKILVTGMVVGSQSTSAFSTYNLVRGSTDISQSTGASSLNVSFFHDNESFGDFDRGLTYMPINFLDSPSTTSSTTYKVQVDSNGGSVYINRRGLNDGIGAVSTITVMEVVA